ncbi:hypothetical protein HZH68_005271 [Vespula germanica]|uniref:Ig-like domain-containing protein n=3 Tax=Vespula TaxID=7451 RepID=A0A834NE46_VESGE|nr:hypothetical protein HZH66_004803 [Vespula vulgaris]KAF7405902.1 hypothetical protein HZH68_005271 [Vespula germanica]KAF7429364.1 hypothetical protein H0235_005762 [Vespula pensylvanica]
MPPVAKAVCLTSCLLLPLGNQIITLLSRLPSVLRSSSVVPIAKPRCQRPLYAHRKSKRHVEEVPTFNNSISNVTVAVGREAVLTCVVSNLSGFKVNYQA